MQRCKGGDEDLKMFYLAMVEHISCRRRGAEEDRPGDIAEKWLAAEDVASPAPPAHATPEPASSTPAPAALINPNPKPKPKP